MKKKGYGFWLKLSIISVISSIVYCLSRSPNRSRFIEKVHTLIRKTKDRLKQLAKHNKRTEDTNKCVIYTLSERARR